MSPNKHIFFCQFVSFVSYNLKEILIRYEEGGVWVEKEESYRESHVDIYYHSIMTLLTPILTLVSLFSNILKAHNQVNFILFG